MYARLAKQNPRDAGLVGQLGTIQTHLGKSDAGIKNLTKAARLDAKSAGIQHNLAVAYRTAGRLDDALLAVDKGLGLKPGDADLIATKVDFLRMNGDEALAWEIIAPAIERENPPVELALAYAPLCARNGCANTGIELLAPFAADDSLANDRLMQANFRLGELLDKEGRYDEAFEAFSRGNGLIRTHHDPTQFEADITRVIGQWSSEAAETWAQASVRSDTPIFIVGMPRSGTTLVEQILASHPHVSPGGELRNIMKLAGEFTGATGGIPMCPDPQSLSRHSLDRIARNYLRDLKKIGPIAHRVTDKNPLNFLYLGLIDRAFPGARVIHCVRDPMDTCLSCFFTDFAGGVAVAADLSHIGHFYRDYERLMERWKTTLALPILNIRYEDLVADLDEHARKIISHVGLEWNDACTRFHETRRVAFTASIEQVRRPIYTTSVARYKNYESHLEPLRSALDANENRVG